MTCRAAMAAPMPRAPPVTMAVLAVASVMSVFLPSKTTTQNILYFIIIPNGSGRLSRGPRAPAGRRRDRGGVPDPSQRTSIYKTYYINVNDHRCPAEDDAAIRNLLGLAALLGDEGAPEDYRRVYAPGATWRMGTVEQAGADEIVAAAASRRAAGISGPGTGTRHLVIPLRVEVTGDSARAVSYFAFLAGTAITVTATYRDELIRTDKGWLISAREVTDG